MGSQGKEESLVVAVVIVYKTEIERWLMSLNYFLVKCRWKESRIDDIKGRFIVCQTAYVACLLSKAPSPRRPWSHEHSILLHIGRHCHYDGEGKGFPLRTTASYYSWAVFSNSRRSKGPSLPAPGLDMSTSLPSTKFRQAPKFPITTLGAWVCLI